MQTLVDTKAINLYIFGSEPQKAVIEELYPGVEWSKLRNELLVTELIQATANPDKTGEFEFGVITKVENSPTPVIKKYHVTIKPIEE